MHLPTHFESPDEATPCSEEQPGRRRGGNPRRRGRRNRRGGGGCGGGGGGGEHGAAAPWWWYAMPRPSGLGPCEDGYPIYLPSGQAVFISHGSTNSEMAQTFLPHEAWNLPRLAETDDNAGLDDAATAVAGWRSLAVASADGACVSPLMMRSPSSSRTLDWGSDDESDEEDDDDDDDEEDDASSVMPSGHRARSTSATSGTASVVSTLTSVASMASMASAQSCGDLASLAAFQVDDYGALDDADGGAGDDDEDIGLCLDEDEDDAETASVATRRSVATASPTGRRPSYDAFDLALKPAARGSLWNAKLYPAGGRAAHAPPACVAADIALPLVKAPGVERSVRPHALQEPSSGYALF